MPMIIGVIRMVCEEGAPIHWPAKTLSLTGFSTPICAGTSVMNLGELMKLKAMTGSLSSSAMARSSARV